VILKILILLFTLPRNWWLFGHTDPRYCVSFLLFSVCLSNTLALSFCAVSLFIGCGQGNHFFSISFCGSFFFTSHTFNPLSVTLSFLPNGLETPVTLIHPLHFVLAFSRLPSCSHSIKPWDREIMSTRQQDHLESFIVWFKFLRNSVE